MSIDSYKLTSGIGFLPERGYFSKANIEAMDREIYEFVIMVKGMATLVKSLAVIKKIDLLVAKFQEVNIKTAGHLLQPVTHLSLGNARIIGHISYLYPGCQLRTGFLLPVA